LQRYRKGYFKESEKEIFNVILIFIVSRISGFSIFFILFLLFNSNTFPKLYSKIFFSKHFLLNCKLFFFIQWSIFIHLKKSFSFYQYINPKKLLKKNKCHWFLLLSWRKQARQTINCNSRSSTKKSWILIKHTHYKPH
jgi:hypothetical protein